VPCRGVPMWRDDSCFGYSPFSLREALIPILRCPSCGAESLWTLDVQRQTEREILDALLTCAQCGTARRVQHGIVDLMEHPPEFVTREAAGLGRFAELMRADGWDREQVLKLPY